MPGRIYITGGPSIEKGDLKPLFLAFYWGELSIEGDLKLSAH